MVAGQVPVPGPARQRTTRPPRRTLKHRQFGPQHHQVDKDLAFERLHGGHQPSRPRKPPAGHHRLDQLRALGEVARRSGEQLVAR